METRGGPMDYLWKIFLAGGDSVGLRIKKKNLILIIVLSWRIDSKRDSVGLRIDVMSSMVSICGDWSHLNRNRSHWHGFHRHRLRDVLDRTVWIAMGYRILYCIRRIRHCNWYGFRSGGRFVDIIFLDASASLHFI